MVDSTCRESDEMCEFKSAGQLLGDTQIYAICSRPSLEQAVTPARSRLRCRRRPARHWAAAGARSVVVVEVGVQVGQDRAPRLEPLDPAQRLGQAEMAGVRPVAQRIDHPDIEAVERRDAFVRQAAQIAGIAEIAEPEARARECRRAAAGSAAPRSGRPRPSMVTGRPGRDAVLVQDRRIFAAGRRLKAIVEALDAGCCDVGSSR